MLRNNFGVSENRGGLRLLRAFPWADNLFPLAILKEKDGDAWSALSWRNPIGRSSLAQLRLTGDTVSAEHASIYYLHGDWKIRDLASRNGTQVNGTPLESGVSISLKAGDRVAFGEEEWIFEDASAPGISARSSQGRSQGRGDVLWLPDESNPEACIQFSAERWLLEQGDDCRSVENGERVVVQGVEWTLEIPSLGLDDLEENDGSTRESNSISEWALDFTVGGAEEHVALSGVHRSQRVDFGARVHNYPLLLLAKERLKDAKAGVPQGEAGWLHRDDLVSMLGSDRKTMNLLLWRARKCVNEKGMPGERLVERRPDSDQLRLGVSLCRVQDAT